MTRIVECAPGKVLAGLVKRSVDGPPGVGCAVIASVSGASLAAMLDFQGFGYRGLGVARFGGRFSNGRVAYGHSGGNIGTTAFMIYLPDVRASLAVMLNTFDGSGASAVTRAGLRSSQWAHWTSSASM